MNAATHENTSRKHEVKGSSDRSFGIVFAVIFLIIGCAPLLSSGAPRLWSLVVAAVLLMLALIYPKSLAVPNRLWQKFGLLLNKIVTPIVMGVMFYLIFTPFGLVMRLFGKDLLSLRLVSQAKSYWIERDPAGPAPETMKLQF